VIIDCNVGFGHWPFARFTEDTPAKLDRLLKDEGIGTALVSSTEAILYEEPEEYNIELERRLRRFPRLIPVPVANLRVRSAEMILARPNLKAVKLIPNYHAYSLRDKFATALGVRAAERGIPMLVQMRVEDERSHYELLKVPGVPVDDIVILRHSVPDLTIVSLCPYFEEAVRLAAEPGIYVDIAFVETLDTLRQLRDLVPAEKVVFGSHTPWLYPRAATAKLELSTIDAGEREAIGWRTAARIFGISGQSS
jgi:predicted TIM-barrel fold metal-dependent hydrolase